MEVCALADRQPAQPDGPALEEEFSPGYRKGYVTHAVGALRLTLPGTYLYGWEQWENGGGTHLWSDDTGEGPVWRVNAYQVQKGSAQFTGNLDTLHGLETRKLKGGALCWGWKEIREADERLYQAVCEIITGPFFFPLTVTCTDPGDLGQVAQLIGRISVVSGAARKETVHT